MYFVFFTVNFTAVSSIHNSPNQGMATKSMQRTIAPSSLSHPAPADFGKSYLASIPMKNLQGFRVAILSTNGFEEAELVEPRKGLVH
jgi:hypothetical protein